MELKSIVLIEDLGRKVLRPFQVNPDAFASVCLFPRLAYILRNIAVLLDMTRIFEVRTGRFQSFTRCMPLWCLARSQMFLAMEIWWKRLVSTWRQWRTEALELPWADWALPGLPSIQTFQKLGCYKSALLMKTSPCTAWLHTCHTRCGPEGVERERRTWTAIECHRSCGHNGMNGFARANLQVESCSWVLQWDVVLQQLLWVATWWYSTSGRDTVSECERL